MHIVTLIFLWGLCECVWVNILTLTPTRVELIEDKVYISLFQLILDTHLSLSCVYTSDYGESVSAYCGTPYDPQSVEYT